MSSLHELFRHFSKHTVKAIGSPLAFFFAVLLVFGWFVSGVIFKYSSLWQSIFNLGVSVITFLLLFLIQHKQNRDAAAINLKLDELIHTSKHARNSIINAENLTEAKLEEHKEKLIKKAKVKNN